jgi:hypothetical protein
MTVMQRSTWLIWLLLVVVFACEQTNTSTAVQGMLNDWFPGQYQVFDTKLESRDTTSTGLVWIQSKANPKLKFSLDYQVNKENGGLTKQDVTAAVKAAETNAESALELLGILQKNGIKNVVLGTHLAQNKLSIQIYEEPFNTVFIPHLRQIQSIVMEWVQTHQFPRCYLEILAMEPQAWGQRFTDLVDARFVERPDTWMQTNTIAEAQADLADPAGADLLPGSLRLSGKRELEIRKKVHADVVDFLRSSKKMDFHVELLVMVNSEWDLRNMEQITYNFPYCQSSKETKKNGGCMGRFDGRIACVYDFKTGDTQVDYQ